jgi:hypothetical protein
MPGKGLHVQCGFRIVNGKGVTVHGLDPFRSSQHEDEQRLVTALHQEVERLLHAEG